MAVYFTELRIRNFRSCVETTLQLTPFTAIVGRNNCGKSNCLTALQWLVRKSGLAIEDFHDPEVGVEVVGELDGLDDAALGTLGDTHRRKIEPYVRLGKLGIRRYQDVPGAVPTLTVRDPNTNDWALNPAGIDNAIKAVFPEPIRIGAMEDAEEDASKAKTSTTIGKLLGEMLGAIRDIHHAELQPHLTQISARLSAVGEH